MTNIIYRITNINNSPIWGEGLDIEVDSNVLHAVYSISVLRFWANVAKMDMNVFECEVHVGEIDDDEAEATDLRHIDSQIARGSDKYQERDVRKNVVVDASKVKWTRKFTIKTSDLRKDW